MDNSYLTPTFIIFYSCAIRLGNQTYLFPYNIIKNNIKWLRVVFIGFYIIIICIYYYLQETDTNNIQVILLIFLVWFNRLDEHLINVHNYPKDEFACELCPRRYCYKPSLLRHRALSHGELRKYPCENCAKVIMFLFVFITMLRNVLYMFRLV